jgi:hypothetical protein
MMNDTNSSYQGQQPVTQLNATRSSALSNGLVVLALAGFVGGMLGAILSEFQFSDSDIGVYRIFPNSLYKGTGVWFALALLGIGSAMSVSQGISERNPEKSSRAALLAVPASLVGGFIAGVIAQAIYTRLFDIGINEIPRSISWGLAGGIGGLAVGAGFRSLVRVRNCALGGLAGGFLGGLAFNTVGNMVNSGVGARFVGITLIGTLIGLAVGLIDMVTVSAFIEQTMREGAPIRFSIFDQSTILGCAGNVGITVRGDAAVSEHHLRLTKQGKGLLFQCVGNAAPVVVNGQQAVSGVLNHGDVFVVGNTQLRYMVGKSTGIPQFGIGQQPHANAATNQPWQVAPQQNQQVGRPSVQMQPTSQVQPGNSAPPPVQQAQPSNSRPIIPIKKPD